MLRILVVAPEPDARDSTRRLELAIDELRRRPGVEVAIWFLRTVEDEGWCTPDRVVDDLRTWRVAAAFDWPALAFVGQRLRGARLRRWFRAADPDVIILEDGMGGRILPRVLGRRRVVLRGNDEPPDLEFSEATWTGPAHLQLLTATGAVRFDPSVPQLRTGSLVRFNFEDAQGPRPADLPPDRPTVVGWGGDGWVDGADLFVRILWALTAREGVDAHGIWYDRSDLPEHRARLLTEAQRAGVADRFELVADPGVDRRWYGDVVVLPVRTEPPDDIWLGLLRGRSVVTFGTVDPPHPIVRICSPLDVEGAAAAVADALAAGPVDRNALRAQLEDVDDVVDWADAFLAAVGGGAAEGP